MPQQRNTIGVPTINLRHNIKDLETRRALEQLSQETTRWLQRIAEGVDTATGLRGEPTYHAAVNAKDNRIMKLGVPKDDTDAQMKGLALSRATTETKSWDARGLPIINLPKDITPSQTDATLTQEQIRALIAEELRKLTDTIAAEPFVTVVASALLTAERSLAAEATVLELVDAGANSTLTINVLANGISNVKLRDSAAVSVIGRSANSSGDPADIAAGANGNILRRAADVLGFGQIDLADSTNAVSGILDEANGGTGNNTYAVGDLLYASTAAILSRLADVGAGAYLRSGGVGVAPLWSTATLPNTTTTGDILYASAANIYANLADVATGQVLASGGVGVAPAYTATPSVTTLTTTGAANIGGDLNHDGSNIGFNGVAPVARDTGWAVSNVTTDRVYDANATSLDEIADVLGTLITYLISRGDLGA